MSLLYIEKALKSHPRTKTILKKLSPQKCIYIDRYTQIFNRTKQHFRLQKNHPAFILAEKKEKLVYKAPLNYGIGAKYNYYFSHLLNCPFDCRYCFLQGMYRSAAFVLFINYEAFQKAILEKINDEKTTFFSGYDGDSLALNGKSGFLEAFFPFFQKLPKAELELRTKSTAIYPLLKQAPLKNCIVAFTLSPERIAKEFELKAPPLYARLKAIDQLQKKGWNIGLRFDPIIYCEDFERIYGSFFQTVFKQIDQNLLHSVTLGSFRLPPSLHKIMRRLSPKEPLFALSQESSQIKQKLLFCREKIIPLLKDPRKLFLCEEMS